MCGGRSSILHYGPLIETNYLYAPTQNGQKPECIAKQKQYPPVWHPSSVVSGHNPGNVPPPSKPEDSIFCETNKSYGMKVNTTI